MALVLVLGPIGPLGPLGPWAPCPLGPHRAPQTKSSSISFVWPMARPPKGSGTCVGVLSKHASQTRMSESTTYLAKTLLQTFESELDSVWVRRNRVPNSNVPDTFFAHVLHDSHSAARSVFNSPFHICCQVAHHFVVNCNPLPLFLFIMNLEAKFNFKV